MSPLGVSLLVAAVLVVVLVAPMLAAHHRAEHPDEPWSRSVPLRIGASAAFVLVGLFVAPKLLGFTFLFLPLLWRGGLGRREPQEREPHDRDA